MSVQLRAELHYSLKTNSLQNISPNIQKCSFHHNIKREKKAWLMLQVSCHSETFPDSFAVFKHSAAAVLTLNLQKTAKRFLLKEKSGIRISWWVKQVSHVAQLWVKHTNTFVLQKNKQTEVQRREETITSDLISNLLAADQIMQQIQLGLNRSRPGGVPLSALRSFCFQSFQTNWSREEAASRSAPDFPSFQFQFHLQTVKTAQPRTAAPPSGLHGVFESVESPNVHVSSASVWNFWLFLFVFFTFYCVNQTFSIRITLTTTCLIINHLDIFT